MKRHMRLDIRGALKNPDALQSFTRADGTSVPMEEARVFLMAERAKGHLYFPMGDCEGFDPLKGCPGHEKEDAP